MPLPILPFVGKVILGGVALGFGNDLYSYGKKKVDENGPIVKEGLGGLWDKVTDVLDPLDLSGQQAAREAKQKSDAAAAATKSAEGKASTAAKAAAQEHAKAMAAVRKEASQKIAAIESKAKKNIAKCQAELAKTKKGWDTSRTKAAADLKAAKADLVRCKMARVADTKVQEQGSPELSDFLYAAYDAITQGAPLPSVEEYAPYGITMMPEPEDFIPEAAYSPWGDIL